MFAKIGKIGERGKEIAEKIHARSKRSGKPFIPVDCGLLSKELAVSELFGYERGAFRRAESKKQGFWEESTGGTLFLDEIGNLPLEVQRMLLRALEASGTDPRAAARTRKPMCASSLPPTRTCRLLSPKSVSGQTSTNG